MAATKFLALLLTFVALLSVVAATDVPPELEEEPVIGTSRVDAAPGLADITAVHWGRCSSYFRCGRKLIFPKVKATYKCYFRKAASALPAKGPKRCGRFPYNCKNAHCKGWKVCTCTKCFRARTRVPQWCEHP